MASNFELDLKELDRAARVDLPLLSSTFSSLASQVASTNSIASDLAADPPVCRTGGASARAWVALRDQIEMVLYVCAKNASDIGTDLGDVVNAYVGTDTQIAADLNNYLKTLPQNR